MQRRARVRSAPRDRLELIVTLTCSLEPIEVASDNLGSSVRRDITVHRAASDRAAVADLGGTAVPAASPVWGLGPPSPEGIFFRGRRLNGPQSGRGFLLALDGRGVRADMSYHFSFSHNV